jgi:hypothetical protein
LKTQTTDHFWFLFTPLHCFVILSPPGVFLNLLDLYKKMLTALKYWQRLIVTLFEPGQLKILFKSPSDPFLLIKEKEIYELLEGAIDKCEDLANVIETILIKYT